METSSYLLINKKTFVHRKMEKHLSLGSNLSLDSLEHDFQEKIHITNSSEENVETILVPFYEHDVLIKVPRDQGMGESRRQNRDTDRQKRDTHSSYLVNKDRKGRRSYLEIFRKQLAPSKKVEPKRLDNEIRSLSPEFGDTERDSISEDPNNAAIEFFNTESYNEIYYEKLLNQNITRYFDHSFEDEIQYNEDSESKTRHEIVLNNFKSVSEVSPPPRRLRRATVQPLPNVKLGGLGPDLENIKPRLERARSLQRYSEKVRMENRLRIYKKSVQAEAEKVSERETSGKHRVSRAVEQKVSKDSQHASYLMNRSPQQKSNQILNKLYSKPPDERRRISNSAVATDKVEKIMKKEANKHTIKDKKQEERRSVDNKPRTRTKSCTRNQGINTDANSKVPPVQINFMVNVGGVRPSSTLKKLEEKHRMYQEQLKSFKMENNDNS